MFGDRLREERERLGLSQPAFGAAADGAAKRTVIDWEKGVSSPTGVQLAALFYAGVDVRYVVTGERDGPPPLKAEERVLLDRYRASPPALRAAWRFGSLVWDDDRGCLMASTPLVEALLGYGVVAGLAIGWAIHVLDVALLQGLAGWRPWASLVAASALYGGGGMLAAWAILRPRRIAQRVARILEHGGIE